MSYQRQVEKKGGRLLIRYTGAVTSDDFPRHNVFQEFVEMSTAEDIREILLDCRKLSVDLRTIEIYRLGCDISRLSDKRIRFAALVTKDWASDKFMENVAFNRGGNFRMFADETEATDWLAIA